MADLLVDEKPRDHADHLAARGERGVGDDAHEPDLAPAVTSPTRSRARRAPSSLATAANVGRRPGRDPQNTQIRIGRNLPHPIDWSHTYISATSAST